MLPQEFCHRMQAMLGDEYEEFIASYDKPKYQAFRLNPLKVQVSEELVDKIAEGTQVQVPWEPTGFYYTEPARPGKCALHEAGAIYVQEPSAMAPAAYLQAQPGEYVLDLCAAPGGKSTQIAGQMQGQGILVSNEIMPNRARILSENMERLGVPNAIVTNESPQKLATFFHGCFDRIMVDAPCSGEGMFRKNEEAAELWTEENVQICADRDDEILDCADHMLSPGGRMVFSTCTFAPSEDEGAIARFLTRHPDYDIVNVPLSQGMEPGRPEWLTPEEAASLAETAHTPEELSKTIRLFPHHLNGEGHYVAVLEKRGTMLPREVRQLGLKPLKGVKWKSQKKLVEFLDATLTIETISWLQDQGELLAFGDQLYRLPLEAPDLKGLKVLRPGLHLGTLLKKRFEPSHALALALRPDQVKHSADDGIVFICKEVTNDRDSLKDKDLLAQSTNSLGENDERNDHGTFAQISGDLTTNLEDEMIENAKSMGTIPLPQFSVEKYISGETFSWTGDKGWYLITTCGISVGWGKLAGGTMKNHYPKGLRKHLL